jgi:hypothetical protein
LALFIWKHFQVLALTHWASPAVGGHPADALEAEVVPATFRQMGGALDRTKADGTGEVIRNSIDIDLLVIKVQTSLVLGLHLVLSRDVKSGLGHGLIEQNILT